MRNNWFVYFFACCLLLLSGCEGKKPDPTPTPDPTVNFETHHYELPVIFHVIYNNSTDPVQAVTQKRLATLLGRANDLFNAPSGKEQDMNVSFKMAETAPDGSVLAEKGVERIQWTGTYPIDCNEFIRGSSYAPLIWDPNKYVNVMVYVFTNSSIGGISHLPYTIAGEHALPGLIEIKYTNIDVSQLEFPYSISINSKAILASLDNTISDPAVILAHELGHYLGLFHVFSEAKDANSCEDTDYCNDTPSYNRKAYDEFLEFILQTESLVSAMETLLKRNSCSGEQFVSVNVMDYYISSLDQFTSDQYLRSRNVLNYSPLIPGPKANASKAAVVSNEEKLDLPIRVVRCEVPAALQK